MTVANKILVIRVGRVGDMVMVTAALSAILKHYLDAEVHVLCGPDGRRALKDYHPHLTKLWNYDRKDWLAFYKRGQFARSLAREAYTQVFNFELNPSFRRFYSSIDAEIHELDRSEPHLHYSQRCLNVVSRALGKTLEQEWAYLPVSEDGRVKAQQLLKTVEVNDSTFVIGIHPSFSGLKKGRLRDKSQNYLREWPPEYFAKSAALLAAYAKQIGMDVEIVMDLLPEERELGEHIVAESGNAVRLLTPPPDFERYKAMIERMNVLIVPNTGPMHIAAAVGTPVVALFSGIRPEDCGPFMPKHKYAVLKAEDKAKPELGISAISVEDVVEACKPFLQQARKSK